MQRYEFSEGKSNKFWEIEREGRTVTTRWGRIGTAGQVKSKELASEALADKEYEKLIAEKTKKGYVQVAGEGQAGEPAGAAATSGFEAAIIADPDDAQAYLVYADWLQEQGDPRGELIVLQHAAAADPGDDSKRALADSHLEAHQDALLGPLAEWQLTQDGREEPAFHWRNGFIYSARLSIDEHGDTEFDGELDELYRMLIGQPSGRFLVELKTGINRTAYDNDQQPIIDAMVKSPPAALRRLHIGDFEPPEESEMSWYHIGKLGKLWGALPRLERLILQGGTWTMGSLDLPELRHIELRTGGLSRASGEAMVKAKIPKVEHLEIWYGTEDYEGGCSAELVSGLIARTDLPRLRVLGLKNADFGDDICGVLAGGKLIAQLTRLDLSMSVLTDDGARVIAENKAAFAHLEELDVSETYVTEEGVALLEGCARRIIANDMRDDEDPEYRFVSVGE